MSILVYCKEKQILVSSKGVGPNVELRKVKYLLMTCAWNA